jgi:UDP-N-acetylmuramate-alanine ligase
LRDQKKYRCTQDGARNDRRLPSGSASGLAKLAYHEAGRITGSATGATPNATEIKANAIRIIEAHTPKAMSEEISRSCLAVGGYKTAGEKKAMSISKSIPWNHDLVAG